MVKAVEKATLVVKGRRFEDWESVQVVHALSEVQNPPFTFRFTASEATPPKKTNLIALQIKPGDECQIFLAGILAFTGYVHTRQVFYNATRHYIEIQGAYSPATLNVNSTVTQTMEMKKVTGEQIIRGLIKPYGSIVNLRILGGSLPTHKFPRFSLSHGVSTFDHIDMVLRALGRFPITSNPQGDLVILAGSTGSGGDSFIEGVNILEGREIIYDSASAGSGSNATLQSAPGDNKKTAPETAHTNFFHEELDKAIGTGVAPLVNLLEVPAWSRNFLQGRTGAESDWQKTQEVRLMITVQGWVRFSGGGLWDINKEYKVNSPMLMWYDDSIPLKAGKITFQQDNPGGTRTTVELYNETALKTGTALQASGG